MASIRTVAPPPIKKMQRPRWRRHQTFNVNCWCKPKVEDGVIIHNNPVKELN